jgi:hypothetical protein
VKRSFRKDFRVIFIREKIEFKKNYLERQGARGKHDGMVVGKRFYRETGHDAWPVWEGETRWGEKSGLVVGN